MTEMTKCFDWLNLVSHHPPGSIRFRPPLLLCRRLLSAHAGHEGMGIMLMAWQLVYVDIMCPVFRQGFRRTIAYP